MNSSSSEVREMPQIPGFRYDAALNRYFKLKTSSCRSEDPPTPRAPKRQRIDTTSASQPKTLYRLLRDYETGKGHGFMPAMKSLLVSHNRISLRQFEPHRDSLAACPSHRLQIEKYYGELAESQPRQNIWDSNDVNSFVEIRRQGTNLLFNYRLFPLVNPYFTTRSRNTDYFSCQGSWLFIGRREGNRVRSVILRVVGHRVVLKQRLFVRLKKSMSGKIAISSEGIPVIASDTGVHMISSPRVLTYEFDTLNLVSRVNKQGVLDLLKFAGRKIGFSLWSGQVLLHDLNAPEQCWWTGNCESRVVDFHSCDNGKILYTSAMRNGEKNLVCWDTRMSGAKYPALRFQGHRNSHSHFKFYVSTDYACDVLAAGGDDHIVRLWDSRRTDIPTRKIDLGSECAEVVKLAGFQGRGICDPTLWVQTFNSLYLYQRPHPAN